MRWVALLVVVLAPLGAVAYADRGTVDLVNGGTVSGEIELWIPGERVVVVTDGGERIELPADEVREVRMQTSPSAATPAPPADESASTNPWATQGQDAPPAARVHVIEHQPSPPPVALPAPERTAAVASAPNEEEARLIRERSRLEGTRESVGGAVFSLVIRIASLNLGIAFAILGSKRQAGADSFWGTNCPEDGPFACERSGAQNVGLLGITVGILGLGLALISFRSRSARRRAREDRIRAIDRQLTLSPEGLLLRF